MGREGKFDLKLAAASAAQTPKSLPTAVNSIQEIESDRHRCFPKTCKLIFSF